MKKKETIGNVIISYYTLLTDAIYNHFHPKGEKPFLTLVRILRSKDESFAMEVMQGFLSYNHSMAFSFCFDHTREGKRKHRVLQMKYFKIALDFCWLIGIKAPWPSWRVTRAFPDLKLLLTKEGRLAYAFKERKRRSELIRELLDHEYAFPENISREDREQLDIERQDFVFRMGWQNMSVEELEKQAREMRSK